MQIRCIIAKVLDKLVLEPHYTLQYNATIFNSQSSILYSPNPWSETHGEKGE